MAGFGFGEAASAIALAQTGFSLARALNSYISDLGDANDDILDLSSDIDSTCRYLRDLAGIIEKNETTKILSDDGIENAKKCVRDSERAITKMRKLLKKATASDTSAEVRPDEIDVSKFAKAKWPFLKPELEVRRRELQSIKLDINILYASYNAKASPDAADRARAEDDLPRLARTRKLMKKQVVDAKRRRDRKSKDSPQIPQPRRRDSYGGYYDPPLYNRRSYSDDGSVEDALDEFIYWNIEDLEKDFEDWAREKEDKRKRAEEETKRLQDRAVEKWKEEQTKEAMRRHREVEENREKLKLELTRTELRLAPQQIEDALNNVYPWPQAGNDLALTPPANQGQSSDADTGSVQTSNSIKTRSRSIWSRLSWAGRPKNNHVNGRHHPEIPELLRDHKAPGGVAELKAFYYQKLSWKGLDFSVLEMEIPTQWLLNTLIAKEEKYLQDRKVNSIWKEFAQLPYDYRYVIDSHISRARNSTEHGGSWVLIYVECQRLEKPSLKLSRKRDVTGVYAVFKKATNSAPAHMLAAADLAFKDDDSISEWSRGSKYRDAENNSIKSDSEKPMPRRASALEPEFKSRSRFDSHGRDHSHIAKRASRSFNRSGYDDPSELRRHHIDQTRSRPKGKDFMPIYEPPIEMHIPDHYLSVDGNPLPPGGGYYDDIGPPPPPPRRDARLWERRRRDEYTNPRRYQPSGTSGPFTPSNPADRFSEFYAKAPRHREYQDRAERHAIPYNEPLSQTAPFDVHYGTTPPFREVPPRPRPYLDPYADMPGDRNYSSDPPPPPIPRRSTSGSYEDKQARFSNNIPAFMNRIPQRPTRRSTDDSSDPPPRHRIIESMDSFPSRLKPDTRFKYNTRPRPLTGPILSDIIEASDDIRHHSDNDSDVSTNSLSSNSSGSVWGYKSRDQSAVERERARENEKENDKTTETADVKEIGREILAKLTTDTTTISTEGAKRNPMGEGQTQAQVQEHKSSVPDENSPRLPSAMGMFGVGLVEEPFDHAVGQRQDEDAGAREGGGQEDTADKTNLRSTDKRT